MKVHASGCTRRMALTTVNPSPGSPMFKSDSRTSNFCVLISSRASGTLLTVVSEKPWWVSTAPSAVRSAASSSTNHNLIHAIGSLMSKREKQLYGPRRKRIRHSARMLAGFEEREQTEVKLTVIQADKRTAVAAGGTRDQIADMHCLQLSQRR